MAIPWFTILNLWLIIEARELCVYLSKSVNFYIYLFYTRLSRRFEHIFYFNCEHFLFLYIKTKTKMFADFIKNIVDLKNFMKIKFIIGGSCEASYKIWSDRFWRFYVYSKKTNKRIDRQANYIYICTLLVCL